MSQAEQGERNCGLAICPAVTGKDYRAEAAELKSRIDATLRLLEDWREHAQPFRYRELVNTLSGKP